MNLEATADLIMSARHSDAFDREACVKIIHAACEKAHQSGWHEGRQYQVEYGGAAQLKPESWQDVEIPLTRGKSTIVSREDADLCRYDWHCTDHGRARRGRSEYLHRVIAERMGITGEVDHIDGNPLNNRRSNIRGCTRAQNQANTQKRIMGGNISKFKGVSRTNKRDKKWSARIKINGKMKLLGRFEVEEDAARAYDKAALEIYAEFARLNFPNNFYANTITK